MARFLSTREVARLLGMKPGTLSMAVWDGRIAEPERGPGDSFLWTDADVQRAARQFGIPWPPRERPAAVTETAAPAGAS